MPYGAFNGVVAVAIPYLLRKQGISVERIATIVALVQAPAVWYVLWAPVVDMKFRRRTWIVLLGVASAVATATALHLTTIGLLGAATGFFVLASALNQPVSSAVGGLVAAVMPAAKRGSAAGWSQAGRKQRLPIEADLIQRELTNNRDVLHYTEYRQEQSSRHSLWLNRLFTRASCAIRKTSRLAG